jgi:ABC-type multidrug transport system fused ATPase/permease subunit
MVPVRILHMHRMMSHNTPNITGKSTLAKILLRVMEFDDGLLQVNGVDIRRYDPHDYHKHLTAVFQNFSKFNFSAKKNVGLGNVEKLGSRPAIDKAIQLAEANAIIESLPHGLRTILDTPGFESVSYPGMPSSSQHHGLSGGEVSCLYFLET